MTIKQITKLSEFKWAKQVSFAWMEIVCEENETLIINDTEIKPSDNNFEIAKKFKVVTKEWYIGRQADFYNQECANGLYEIEEWIDTQESLAIHKRGIELGLVKLIPGEQELLERLKYELY